jgi:hypothetical protein
MEVIALLFLIVVIVLFQTVEAYQLDYSWPVARPALEATWAMNPSTEGFANMTLKQWLPVPEVLTKPSVGECPGSLMNAAGYHGGLAVKNYDLLSDRLQSKDEIRKAIGPTSEKCYGMDYSKKLELSSYAQRTNNYIHKSPESCSAKNHDLILGFYKD